VAKVKLVGVRKIKSRTASSQCTARKGPREPSNEAGDNRTFIRLIDHRVRKC
jgi:hypothetical protein